MENTEEEVPECRSLTQEVVNEQVKGLIALLTRQLEELTGSGDGDNTASEPSPQDWLQCHFWYNCRSARQLLKSELITSKLYRFEGFKKIL